MRNSDASPQVTEVEPAPQASARPTFRTIFDAELSFIWNSLRRLGVADRDLEDVAHEVFLVVDRRLADYDVGRPLRAWLFGIAVRTASDYRRRASRRYETLAGEQPESVHPGEKPDELLIEQEKRDTARLALLRVPEDRRAALILHDFENVPMRDVAEALGIPLKTAYSRVRVGREELIAAARRLQKEGT